MKWELQKAIADNHEFLWNLHCLTMREYVEKTWGWDESVQKRFFTDKFDPDDYEIIVLGAAPIGCLQFKWHISDLHIETLQIQPPSQNIGLGTSIVKSLQKLAAGKRRDVSVRVLKCNPAGRLFDRLGFAKVGETDTHVTLTWKSPVTISL